MLNMQNLSIMNSFVKSFTKNSSCIYQVSFNDVVYINESEILDFKLLCVIL